MPVITDEKLAQWIARGKELVAEVRYLKGRESLLLETIKLAIVAARGDARTFAALGRTDLATYTSGRADRLQDVLDEATGPAQPVTPADAVA